MQAPLPTLSSRKLRGFSQPLRPSALDRVREGGIETSSIDRLWHVAPVVTLASGCITCSTTLWAPLARLALLLRTFTLHGVPIVDGRRILSSVSHAGLRHSFGSQRHGRVPL